MVPGLVCDVLSEQDVVFRSFSDVHTRCHTWFILVLFWCWLRGHINLSSWGRHEDRLGSHLETTSVCPLWQARWGVVREFTTRHHHMPTSEPKSTGMEPPENCDEILWSIQITYPWTNHLNALLRLDIPELQNITTTWIIFGLSLVCTSYMGLLNPFQYCNDWSTTVRVCCMASEMLVSQGWNTLLSWAGLGRRSLLDGRGWKKVGVTGWQQRDLTKGCNIYKGHCNLEYINARLDQTHRRIAHTVFRAFAHDLQFFAHAANADSSNIQSACKLGTAVQVKI